MPFSKRSFDRRKAKRPSRLRGQEENADCDCQMFWPLKKTNLDQAVMRMASIIILASASLAYWHNENWLLLTAFAGLNMMQASFTGFCPVVSLLKKLGIKSGAAFK